MVLLITGTIVSQSTYMTYLFDASERLKQYIDCIKFYLNETSFDKIVFCENSNFRFNAQELFDIAKDNNKCFELIQFEGNSEKIAEKGKGFGEGEIIEYAFSHSKLMKQATYFVKVTGRLIVNNIDYICKKMDCYKVYFILNIYYYPSVDTRMYAMPISVYKNNFIKAYYDVDDKDSKYIESIFYNIIHIRKIKILSFKSYPIFNGVSGSCGINYSDDIRHIKWMLQIACRLNCINKKCFFGLIYRLLQIDRKICSRRLFTSGKDYI